MKLLRSFLPAVPKGRTAWARVIHKNMMRSLFFVAFFNMFVIYAPTHFVQKFPDLPTIPETQMQNKLYELQKTCADPVPTKLPNSVIIYRTDTEAWSRTEDPKIVGDAMDWAIKHRPSKYSVTKARFCK